MADCPYCGCGAGHHLYSCGTLEKGEKKTIPMTINSFSGEHRFLSNFWPCAVIFDGDVYPTTEHAYQAAKTILPNIRRQIREAPLPAMAKKMGTQIALRADWDDVRLSVMEVLLRQKFAPGTALREYLDATKGQEIIEGNRWHDLWWGQCTCSKHNGEGRNELGKLLMRIRDEDNGLL